MTADDVLIEAGRLAAEGRPFALATVVASSGPPRRGAATARSSRPTARCVGWVGGACSEPIVVREALRALADGEPRLLRIGPPGSETSSRRPASSSPRARARRRASSRCSSSRSFPRPLLAVVGESPAARTLAELARTIGWRVESGRAEGADAVVVASMGHGDEDALADALAAGTGYVGLVASSRRASVVLAALRARGVEEADLARVRSPAGLDLGPSTQEEIAVAVLAELVAWRHAARPGDRVPTDEVIDPVCGMIVPLAGAKEVVVHEGVTLRVLQRSLPQAVRARSRGLPGCRDAVKDVLPTLERWTGENLRVATATVVKTERSAPRDPGAVLAVSERGEVAGSVTGGCVEPAVFREAEEVLAGGPPRLKTYGIADDEAFDVGLPCGGIVHIFVDAFDPGLVAPLAAAIRTEEAVALEVTLSGAEAGAKRLVRAGEDGPAAELLARGETGIVDVAGEQVFVSSFAPRPRLYVFGAVDHAGAVAEVGRFLGYHVTVCDARAKFATRERFPDVDELVVEWPDRFLVQAPVDERTAICVLTHDHKFDVPLLKVALETRAGYIGAMGSSKTTQDREQRLLQEGVTEEQLARVHAPIGLPIGARTPEEVAVAIAAELVSVVRRGLPARERQAVAG